MIYFACPWFSVITQLQNSRLSNSETAQFFPIDARSMPKVLDHHINAQSGRSGGFVHEFGIVKWSWINQHVTLSRHVVVTTNYAERIAWCALLLNQLWAIVRLIVSGWQRNITVDKILNYLAEMTKPAIGIATIWQRKTKTKYRAEKITKHGLMRPYKGIHVERLCILSRQKSTGFLLLLHRNVMKSNKIQRHGWVFVFIHGYCYYLTLSSITSLSHSPPFSFSLSYLLILPPRFLPQYLSPVQSLSTSLPLFVSLSLSFSLSLSHLQWYLFPTYIRFENIRKCSLSNPRTIENVHCRRSVVGF
jgi:hypothetical protein